MADLVWQSMLDDAFDCRVQRTAPYNGTLTVQDTRNGSFILEENVTISYDAKFGPDIDDVGFWQQKCVDAVDGRTS